MLIQNNHNRIYSALHLYSPFYMIFSCLRFFFCSCIRPASWTMCSSIEIIIRVDDASATLSMSPYVATHNIMINISSVFFCIKYVRWRKNKTISITWLCIHHVQRSPLCPILKMHQTGRAFEWVTAYWSPYLVCATPANVRFRCDFCRVQSF